MSCIGLQRMLQLKNQNKKLNTGGMPIARMQETGTGFGLAYGSHVVVPERVLCSTPTNTPNIVTEKFVEIE